MDRMPTELPLDALEMALWVRDRAGEDVVGVIQHSDAGSQYTALRYSERLADVGAIASVGTVGDSYDNALAETVVGLYKTECVTIDAPFRTADELELATLSWVHWFNENRLHSSIGYLTPIEMENEYYVRSTPRASRRWENSPSTKPGAIQHVGVQSFADSSQVLSRLPRSCGGHLYRRLLSKRHSGRESQPSADSRSRAR